MYVTNFHYLLLIIQVEELEIRTFLTSLYSVLLYEIRKSLCCYIHIYDFIFICHLFKVLYTI